MILVIEDDEMMRDLLKTFLTMDGHEVMCVRDGIEGVNAYKAHSGAIRLVITDFAMPNLNGAETYRQIQTINPAAKVIMISGNLDTRTERQLHREGIQHFMHKPFRPEEIVAKVKEVMGDTGN
ncbi:MAG: response regulator [Bacteroidota bacterium]|nr:response regulator [Bacteroidota bacterium]